MIFLHLFLFIALPVLAAETPVELVTQHLKEHRKLGEPVKLDQETQTSQMFISYYAVADEDFSCFALVAVNKESGQIRKIKEDPEAKTEFQYSDTFLYAEGTIALVCAD